MLYRSIGILFFSAACCSHAAEAEWLKNYPDAIAQASQSQRKIIIEFTGSDWCVPCHQLKKNVLDHPDFRKATDQNYLFVEIDKPKDKSHQSEAEQKQAANFAEVFRIEAVPTLYLADSQGRPYYKIVNHFHTPENMLSEFRKADGVLSTRDTVFADAEKKQGLEKARAMYGSIQSLALPSALVIQQFYPKESSFISQQDPKDELGYQKAIQSAHRVQEIKAEISKRIGSGQSASLFDYLYPFTHDESIVPADQQALCFSAAMAGLDHPNSEDKIIQLIEKAQSITPYDAQSSTAIGWQRWLDVVKARRAAKK